MSIGPTPPQSGPMLSPDGKWVWDGTEWKPIPQREALFPSWQSIAVDPVAPVAPAAQPAGAPVQVAAPVAFSAPALTQPVDPGLAYAPYGLSMPESAPPWRSVPKPTGMNLYYYLIAGVVGIVIVLVVLNSVFPLWLMLPGPKPPPAPVAAQASPPPVASRSDYARADYFVSGVLGPQVTDLNHVLTPVGQACAGALTTSCQNALDAAVPKMKTVLALFDHNTVPGCVAAPVARVKGDLVGMNNAMQAAEKAYADNQGSELFAAMSAFSKFRAVYASDVPGLTNAMKAQCDTQVLGP